MVFCHTRGGGGGGEGVLIMLPFIIFDHIIEKVLQYLISGTWDKGLTEIPRYILHLPFYYTSIKIFYIKQLYVQEVVPHFI